MIKLKNNKKDYFNSKSDQKQSVAYLYGYRASARKARIVANMIRGESVVLAMNYLMFQEKAISRVLKLLLVSAISNAKSKGLNVNYLFISEIIIDNGPIMKRFISRAHGKATKIRKRTSHIKIKLQQF